MGHGKSTFKQADLTRALRAVEKAGRDVVRAEIARDGRIVLVFKNGEEKARVVGARGKDAILREIEPQIAA